MEKTTYWPQEDNNEDTLKFICILIFVIILVLSPLIVVLIGFSQNEVKSYTSNLTVIEKYETTNNNLYTQFNPGTEMSEVSTENEKIYIIVVNYANAEEGKAEIEIDMDSYNKINVGDKVNVKIQESYPENESSFEKENMLYYEIFYIK